MKRVEDFNEFLSDHVNINQSRLDKLNDHVAAVTTHLSRSLESFEKVERQGSYALRTVIKPKEKREYDADVLLFMTYRRGKEPADYINEAYNCLRQHGTYKDMVYRKTRCVMVDYAGDFHLDIVPCVEFNGQRYICNNKTDATTRPTSSKLLTEPAIGTGSTGRLRSPTATSSESQGC